MLQGQQGSQPGLPTTTELRQREIVYGMSTNGCYWDNTVVESIFINLLLKLDLDDNQEALITLLQLQRDLAIWVGCYDNRERRHSTIGYRSPIGDEQRLIAAPALTPVIP
ncbi:hypothetical protein FQK07_04680 [Synechococcus sp. BSF8S]|uniref:hypothetical protein n=1 Tax=Synechococcales TaxID=1890424 RepID=UPI00162873C8|nr:MULTISPECIES: hypothetical protein [unclassified Synechococcus]MBC1260570.1 hypothetical protein [Synechococcus sp. BSF8S]MBC1263221.1 hypothetical protein [Synechococcus sp. BSA11S]